MGFNNSFLSSFSVMLLPVIWIRECIISSLCISFNKKEVVTSFWTPAFSTFFFPHMSSLECREEKKKENTMDNALKTNFQALKKRCTSSQDCITLEIFEPWEPLEAVGIACYLYIAISCFTLYYKKRFEVIR